MCRLFLGFFFISLSVLITKMARCLAPWNVLNDGLSIVLHIPIGKASILVGTVVLGIDILLKADFGLGTLLNIAVIGNITDLLFLINDRLGLFFPVDSVALQILFCIIGVFVNGLGIYFYLSARMGAGPRDGLIVFLTKKLSIPVAVVKLGLEATVCTAGVLMGGEMGIGTLVAVACGGPILQLVFRLFRFNVKKEPHENLMTTCRYMIKDRFIR